MPALVPGPEEATVSAISPVQNSTARFTDDHPGLVKLARLGWLAKGVVYLLAGVLVLLLVRQALGWSDAATSQEASPNGALKEIASTSWGPALMWALAIGLFLYALWRIASALLPGQGGAESWARRIGYLCSAALYGFLGVTAVALARSEQVTDGNQTVSDAAKGFMENSAGRWLVGIAGVILVAVGLYRIKKAVTQDVEDELDLGGMSASQHQWIRRLAEVGEIGRGVALGLVGFFLVRGGGHLRSCGSHRPRRGPSPCRRRGLGPGCRRHRRLGLHRLRDLLRADVPSPPPRSALTRPDPGEPAIRRRGWPQGGHTCPVAWPAACSTRCPTASTASSSASAGKGRLSEADVDEVLREIRTALLEADVNVRVVRPVVARIREQTVGLELLQGAEPQPAGHQDRQRRAHQPARRRDPQADLRARARRRSC